MSRDNFTGIEERWEKGIPHDPRSIEMYKFIELLDYERCGDSFGFKSGGDGDNGENLMYLMDIYFELKDKGQKLILGKRR